MRNIIASARGACHPAENVSALPLAAGAAAEDAEFCAVRVVQRYVLRGIRHYDHRTLRGRELDAWEDEALLAVQRPYQPPPPPPVTRKDR